MKSSGGWAIGELADRFGLAAHVLRHWESVGLLTPGRDAAGQRRYAEADVVRIALILIGKDTGFGLRELKELMSAGNPMDHPELLRAHVAVLEERIAKTTAAKEFIEHALACPLPFGECPHARGHIEARIPPELAKPARDRT